jgi:hypothetical protein
MQLDRFVPTALMFGVLQETISFTAEKTIS